MKKFGRPRTSRTEILYCNKHGYCEWVLIGKKTERWKCLLCEADYATAYRLNQKKKAVEYKGGSCEACGYNKYIGSMDFHHLNPENKEFNLGGTGIQKRWDKLKIELDKCQLLCKNCHNEVHDQMDKQNDKKNQDEVTKYHRKFIHKINSIKLGKLPSP